MKDFSSSDSLAVTKAKIDSNIITGTLDTLNSGQFTKLGNKKKGYDVDEAMKSSTDFQKRVLNSVYAGKGTIIDSSK